MLVFLNAPLLVLQFANYALMTLQIMLCAISIYADDTTFCSRCKQASDLWQQLEFELNLNLTYLYCGQKLVDFNAGKTQYVLFDLSKTMVSIDVKMSWPVIEEN